MRSVRVVPPHFLILHEHISDTEAARVSVLKEGPTTPKS